MLLTVTFVRSFVLAAVSPAVVVPSMLLLQREGYGVEKVKYLLSTDNCWFYELVWCYVNVVILFCVIVQGIPTLLMAAGEFWWYSGHNRVLHVPGNRLLHRSENRFYSVLFTSVLLYLLNVTWSCLSCRFHVDEHPERSPGGCGRGHRWADSGSVLVLLPKQRPGLTSIYVEVS